MPHSFSDRGAQNLLFAYCLLARLWEIDACHFVISPGSRSTPLTLSAAQLAAQHGCPVSVMLDERSAGFFALGGAKATGRPAVLICTSGTAAANYYPAVIEARMTQTPLIVISADRPADLQRKMSPQTIHQRHLFGEYPRLYAESEELLEAMIAGSAQKDETSPGSAWQARFREVSELADTLLRYSSKGGPVHLNAAFSKPLEPSSAEVSPLIQLAGEMMESSRDSVRSTMPSPENRPAYVRLWKQEAKPAEPTSESTFSAMMQRLGRAARPLVITGPLNVGSYAERALLEVTSRYPRIPHIFEATSSPFAGRGPGITGVEGFLRQPDIRAELKPDLILRVGAPPVSRALNTFLQDAQNVPQLCFSSTEEPPDPLETAAEIVTLPAFSPLPDTLMNVLEAFTENASERWAVRWKTHSQNAATRLENIIPGYAPPADKARASENPALTDGSAIRMLIKHVEKPSKKKPAPALFVSNSFTVRDLDLFRHGPLPFHEIGHSRGASGIDGIISTALGYCTGSGRETWLVIGDLAFLHDTNGLLQLAQHQGPDFRMLVINNLGGNIFRMLPVYSHDAVYTPYFETPQHADISALCRAHGIKARVSETDDVLFQQLEAFAGTGTAPAAERVMVFEARTDAHKSMKQRNRLWSCDS